jgi:EAL and modified HD-GYP domain-containing signal transduction protein
MAISEQDLGTTTAGLGEHGTDVVVARQPIFDAGWNVVAYELLYRPVSETPEAVTPESMTAALLTRAFSDVGLEALVGGLPAHINVTRDFLLAVRPLPLSPGRTVIELVEDQLVDAQLIAVLREAVDAGFTLALDRFQYAPKMEPLLKLASIVKLDVPAFTPAALTAEVRRLEPRKLRLIAQKVEEAEQYELCRELDFDGYQGYFFALPELSRAAATPTRDLGTLCAIASTDASTTFEELERIISRDAGLSHKLLRFSNSAYVSPLNPIASLQQALTMIGTIAIRRWGLLLSLTGLRDGPHHLLSAAMVRARMGELLASSMSAHRDRAFTVGLFSLLDAMTGRPLAELVSELPFDDRLAEALLDHAGPEGKVLSATLAYERGDFDAAAEHVSAELLLEAYQQAVQWSDHEAPALR